MRAVEVFRAAIQMQLDRRNSFKIVTMLSLLLMLGCDGSFFRGPNDLIDFAVTPLIPTSILVGSMQQYTSAGVFGDYSTGNVTAQTIWSSSDPTIATIDATGTARGIAFGTVTITGSCQSYSISSKLTVSAATRGLVSITVTPASALALAGGTQQFIASGTYSDGSTTVITNGATWTSSNLSVASIDNAGFTSAIASGTAVITASSGSSAASATLTVR
jgi:hypothetical protein